MDWSNAVRSSIAKLFEYLIALSIARNDNFEQHSLRHSQPAEADKHIGDVIVPTNPEDKPCHGILSRLETLDEVDK